MSNRITPIRYIVQIPNQALSPSYSVGLGLEQAQFYADLTAKTYRGTIFAQDTNGDEEEIGSYARAYPARPHQPADSSGAPV